jgi:hypothetical protein
MGNLRRGIDVWRQGTRPKKIASEGTPPKEMQSDLTCTSERTPQRGEISTLGGVDTVTAGHTGVSRRQSDRRR